MNLKGNSILEWSVVLSIVLAAFMAMQTYMQRGIQGMIKAQADQLGGQTEQTLKFTQSNSTSSSFSRSQKSEGFDLGSKEYSLTEDNFVSATSESTTQQNFVIPAE
jgi:hypothetical protein